MNWGLTYDYICCIIYIESEALFMRYTTDAFIEKANKIHNNKYDYSKVDFKNVNTKVKIICPIHGEFEQKPFNHLRGQGCRKCGRESLRELQKQGKGPWSKAARKKASETMEQKFGAKTWAESDIGRETLKDMCSSEDVRAQMSARAKSFDAREHYRQTSLKNHGAEHWTQTEQGKQKLHDMFNTDEERYLRSQRMLSDEVRAKIEATSMERYGVPYYWQSDEGRKRLKELLNSEEVIEKTRQTNLERYGCETWQGSVEGRQKLASEEVRSKTEKTNYERYGAKTWSNSDDGKRIMSDIISSDIVQNKMINTKREHGTINDSQPERDAYILLVQKFGKDDVIPQYRSERYPYKCDFYIKSLDLFIELNIYWMHGGHFFDENNDADLEKLQLWLANDKPSYERAIYVWTQNDLEKRDTALKNNLNYLVFWNQDLCDFMEWLNKC